MHTRINYPKHYTKPPTMETQTTWRRRLGCFLSLRLGKETHFLVLVLDFDLTALPSATARFVLSIHVRFLLSRSRIDLIVSFQHCCVSTVIMCSLLDVNFKRVCFLFIVILEVLPLQFAAQLDPCTFGDTCSTFNWWHC